MLGTFGEWTEGITLIPGANGVFEVAVNGKQVYSKKATGRFPEMQELNEAVRKFLE